MKVFALILATSVLLTPDCSPEEPDDLDDKGACEMIPDGDGDGCPEMVCDPSQCPSFCTCPEA